MSGSLGERFAFRQLRLLAVLALGGATVFLGVRFFSEFHNSRERGRFVVSMVKEHLMTVGRLADPRLDLASSTAWSQPGRNELLRNWLILNAVKNQDPEITSRQLDDITHDHEISPEMKSALIRWNSALTRWSRERSKLLMGAGPDELLKEGRERYHEATGYSKIGKSYDATVLYLWSADFLTRFIEAAPLRGEVPEALYMVGDSFAHFQKALPARVRSDRLLNLCVELFPGSIWADRATALWQGEAGHGV